MSLKVVPVKGSCIPPARSLCESKLKSHEASICNGGSLGRRIGESQGESAANIKTMADQQPTGKPLR